MPRRDLQPETSRDSTRPLFQHCCAQLQPTPRSADEVMPALEASELADAFIERSQDRQVKRRTVLVHLWEDQWEEHHDVVQSRLLAMLGRSSARWMARQTVARRIDAATATDFLLEHHLWGATQSRFRYGLYLRNEPDTLVAVATFSARWRKRLADGEIRHSHELIRFCSRRGETVVGGHLQADRRIQGGQVATRDRHRDRSGLGCWHWLGHARFPAAQTASACNLFHRPGWASLPPRVWAKSVPPTATSYDPLGA